MRVVVCVLLFLGALPQDVIPSPTQVTVFDTFLPGDVANANPVYGVDGSDQWQAFQFVPMASGRLFDVTVALGRTGTNTTLTQFDLYRGAEDTLGDLLESFIVPNEVPVGISGAVVTFNSIVQPELTSGQYYWLRYTESDAADRSLSLWFGGDRQGIRLTSFFDAEGAPLPAFRVTVVPEPTTFTLLVLGSLALVMCGRRR